MNRRSLLAAVCAACVSSTSCVTDALLGSGPRVDNEAIFDEVWQAFDLHYSYFGLKGIDWNASRARYRPDAIAAANGHALASTIGAMMRELRDVHVVLTPANGIASHHYVSESEMQATHFSSQVVDYYVADMTLSSGGKVRYGHLGEDVGYVGVESFRGRGWIGEFDEALRALDVAALVIDLRD